MKIGYYFLLPLAALAASSACYAANSARLKEAPKSAAESTYQRSAAEKRPQVVKPPQVAKPPQVSKPPQPAKPPAPPKATTPKPNPYVAPPPVKENPPPTVSVPEPGTAVLFATAFGLLLMLRRARRPARIVA